MTKYYGIATTTKGKEQLINFNSMGENAPKYLFQAEEAAQQLCKKEGLIFKSAHIVQGTQKQAKTLTKFKSERARTGKNGKDFAKAL